MQPVRKLVVVGVGLIGGSFALALRRAQAVERVVGVGRGAAALQAALRLGVIDEAADDWTDALAGADFVLLATPVGQMDRITRAMAPHLAPGTVVTDAGSTKGDVVAAFRGALGAHLPRTVPSHPIAGAEKSGVEAASASLFDGRKVVVTPLPENDPAAVQRVGELWRACGAALHEMAPEQHDAVFAAVSHLPHLLAFGLVHELSLRENAPLLFGFAASGFRDFTRIAGSHPEMWRDICMANRGALLGELDAYRGELELLRALLEAGDAAGLEAVFTRAREARNAWAAQYLAG